MKNMAGVFEKINQSLSEKELRDLLIVTEQFLDKKVMECSDIEAEICLVQEAKTRLEHQLESYLASAAESHARL